MLIYLNDVGEGGETRFTRLAYRPGGHGTDEPQASQPLAVTPEAGKALLFFPSSSSGAVDQRLEHEACATACDVKWVAQVWLRQRPDPTRTFIDNPSSV